MFSKVLHSGWLESPTRRRADVRAAAARRHRARSLWVVVFVLLLTALPTVGQELGNAQLLIAGTSLTIEPASQTVPYETPTIVQTRLEGFDADRGTLPPGLRVIGDLTGPEIDGVLTLETVPNQPFRIPRLTLRGEYRLDDIRLVDGDTLLAFAEPRTATILVTQILVTRVTSRPLTLEEIRARGIVIDEDNFQAFNFAFGFALETGETVEHNVGLVLPRINGAGGGGGGALPDSGRVVRIPGPPSFRPPKIELVTLEPQGCASGCANVQLPPIPAAIVFPFDNAVLNQFFSVMLLAQNGAPEGDVLVLRDLAADIRLPAALRPAETQPPTPLGVPVPVRVPGPDGELGTADDSSRIGAQETGEAEFLIEGRREGNHIVTIDIEGVLEGLPTGIQPMVGQARGAVLVRDPTFGVILTHPRKVVANQEYLLRLSVTNTSNAPANLLTVELPTNAVAGAEVLGSNLQVVDTLLPGATEVLKFELRARVGGRVVATAVKTGDNVSAARIELTNEVGSAAPLAPNAVVLPPDVGQLPEDLVDDLLAFAGLAHTVATTPRSVLEVDLPAVSLGAVEKRLEDLARAGRHHELGEELVDVVAMLAADWMGAGDGLFDFDEIRRASSEGAFAGFALGRLLGEEAERTSPLSAFERFVRAASDLPPQAAVLAVGDGVEIEVASRTTGDVVFGSGVRTDRIRDLPFADLWAWDGAQTAYLARPEDEGYQVRLRSFQGAAPELHLLVPDTDGALRVARFSGLAPMAPGGLAVVDFQTGDDALTLFVDADGDGMVEAQIPAVFETLAPRPFEVLRALQNANADEGGHVVDVLFSREVDLGALLPVEPARFEVDGKLSNGGVTAQEAPLFEVGSRSRIVRVVFDNPLSPFVAQQLRVEDVRAGDGGAVVSQSVLIDSNLTTPGIVVTGRVIGPDGEPLPFAPVELFEFDKTTIFGQEQCVRHKTAAVAADAFGQYTFDYVRQTACGGDFQMRAVDPEGAHEGLVRDRARNPGETLRVDIVMLGRGVVRGRVLYEDGTVPAAATVIAYNDVQGIGKDAAIDANGNYEIRDVPVGTITLQAVDGDGNFGLATIELSGAGAVAQKDLTIFRQPDQPMGELRARVLGVDGVTPVFNAFAIVRGELGFLTTRRTDDEGRFTIPVMPAGPVRIEVFSTETGAHGASVATSVQADAVTEVDILLLDERGTVEGRVFVETANGLEPAPMAIVWADGTPINTVTDDDGFYRLSGVVVGNRRISAIDAGLTTRVDETVSITFDGQVVTRDLIFRPLLEASISGEVLDFDGNPVAGATVHTQFGATQWLYEAFTDANGQFLIPDVPTGEYRVHAYRGGAGASATVDVVASGQTAFVSLRFKKGAIRGVVKARQESGELLGVRSFVTYNVPSVKFGLVRNWDTLTIETADDGAFEIPDVLVGPYSVTASNPFFGSQTVRGDLTFDGDVAEHEFVFELNGSIRGVVRSFDGVTPVEGALVSLEHPDFSSFEVETDAAGEFRFELVPPAAARFPIVAFFDDGMHFRRARVYVEFTRQGQILDDVEIVLPKQGSVMGFVEDQLANRVPGLTVTLAEGVFPFRRLAAITDAEGSFSFDNVFAGPLTVTAASPDRGTGGKTTADLFDEEQELVLRIPVDIGVGELSGRVISPIDGSPVSSVQLDLFATGLREAAVASADGEFTFIALQPGTYRMRAFDPATGRAGELVGIEIGESELVEVELVLEARGSVIGSLNDPDSAGPVPGETIILDSDGIFSFKTYSSTDADGEFEFGGIPQGEFELLAFETAGRRRASGEGEIVEEDQVVRVDLFWEATGVLTGRVLAADGSDELFAGPVSTALLEGSPGRFGSFPEGFGLVNATLENPYSFGGAIEGRFYAVEATEQGGLHRGLASVTMEPGQLTQTVDVRMVPLGTIVAAVRDNLGNPVSGVDVRLVSEGFYGRRFFIGATDAAGEAVFANVGEGFVTATATQPLTGLAAAGSAELRFDDQTLLIVLTLEDTASLRGTVLLPDGTTSAENALVSLRVGADELLAFADASGFFEFPAAPLGDFRLALFEDAGPGQQEISGTLSFNGELVDVGTLVLDAADPAVLEIVPPPAAAAVVVDVQPTIRFSESIDRNQFSSSDARLRRTNGSDVSVSHIWTEGDTLLTLVPNQPLESFTTYQIRVSSEIKDLAGRRIGTDLQTSFTTADVLPPTVVFVFPEDGAINVPPDVQMRVVFSEPVDADSLPGGFELLNVATGQPVAISLRLEPDQREVLVDQIDLLAEEELYTLTVQGVTDLGGNVLPAPVSTTFRALDVTAPVFESTVPPGSSIFLSGDDVSIRATVSDNVGVAAVRFALGDRIETRTAPPFSVVFPAPTVDAPEDFEITLEASDAAGNQTTAVIPIRVEPLFDPNRPTISLLCPSGRAVLAPGTGVDLSLEVDDDQGVERIELFLGDDPLPFDTVLSPSNSLSYRFDLPITFIDGQQPVLRAVAVDFGGGRAEARLDIRVAEGTVVATDTTIAPDNLSFEGQSVIVAGGTLTIEGPHQFRDLVVLDGATVTHVGQRLSVDHSLDLSLQRELFVSCAGAIAGDNLGYCAGVVHGVPTDGFLEPEEQFLGGTYGGRGGRWNATGVVYGSLFDPHDPGSGPTSVSSFPGDFCGGGIVRIAATEALIIDGALRVNGASGGTGGSIRLDSPVLTGAGSIEAAGSDRNGGGGGGGRIAIYADVDDGLLGRTSVRGGRNSADDPARQGGAGTLYVKRPSDVFGELILDNEGQEATLPLQTTELPAIGSGTVDQADTSSITDLDARFAENVSGLWVALNDDFSQLWRVISHSDQTLFLDTSAAPLTAVPGDSYRGIYRFDQVTVRGAANGSAVDRVVADAGIDIEAGATFVHDHTEAPSQSLSLDPSTSVLIENDLEITADATDASGLARLEIRLAGALAERRIGLPQGAASFQAIETYTMPFLTEESSVDVSVRTVDAFGLDSVATATVAVLPDTTPPVVVSAEPVAGTTFMSGESIQISAVVVDDVRLRDVSFSFDGQSRSFLASQTPFEWDVVAPPVTEVTILPVVIESSDTSGNPGSFSFDLVIEPLANVGIPEVEVACPSPGARIAAGAGIDIVVDATDDEEIERVEVFLDDVLAGTATVAPYVVRVTAPAGVTVGTTLTARAVAFDFAGNSAEASVALSVVDGFRINSNTTISASDFGLDGLSLVIEDGTVTIDGEHAFADLFVLGDAKVTHPFTDINQTGRLQLALSGDLYVACGATLDGSYLGYTSGRTFPANSLAPFRRFGGGSHGGRGRLSLAPTYGSVFDPADPGAGGMLGNSGSSFGGNGGGVVRIAAEGAMVVDGAIRVNGREGNLSFSSRGGGGAGGSIRLDAASLSGRGSIEASSDTTGSGGRIAIYSDVVDTDLLSRVEALGEGAGTIYLERSDQSFGELIVDGGDRIPTEITELVPVGRGTVGTVTADSFTDPAAEFRHTSEGVWVAFNDDLATLWQVVSHAHLGDTLTLDVASQPLIAQPADIYQGVYRFDRVTVRGGAQLWLEDRLLSGEPPQVEEGSSVLDGDPASPGPQAAINFEPGGDVVAGQELITHLFASSLVGIDRLELEVSGPLTDSQLFTFSGEQAVHTQPVFDVPGDAAGATLVFTLRAFDTGGLSAEVTRGVTIQPDLESPTLTVISPLDGSAFTSGDRVRVTATASDQVRVADVTVDMGSGYVTAQPGEFDAFLWVPPVDAPTALPVVVTATDPAGNSDTVVLTLQVSPLADVVAPDLGEPCPSTGALVLPGGLLRTVTAASDDVNIFSLEVFLGSDPEPAAQTFGSGSLNLDLPISDSLSDGETLDMRFVATDFGNNVVELVSQLRAVEGTVVSSDLTLAVGDSSLEGQNVIVDSLRTLTIEGSYSFRNLVIQQRGTLTHPETDATTDHRLELAVQEDVYVACSGVNTLVDGRIFADARGYLGASGSGVGYTYPNSQVGGAFSRAGGSHGGVGGGFGPATYGSLFDPDASGSGGGLRSSTRPGGDGGGVIRIVAGGNIVIDGHVTADGEAIGSSGAGAGAGGSILLDAARISGRGSLSATGGSASTSSFVGSRSGGGGRIALYGAEITDGMIGRTSAAGGSGGSSPSVRGGPGTVYVKRDAQPFGDLIVDNEGLPHGAVTDLPTVGFGVVDAVGADTLTDFEASFRYSSVGAAVAINGDFDTLFPIIGHPHLGDTLTLDVSTQPLTAQVGDSYRGVWSFDRIVVRGSARAQAQDVVVSTEEPEVDPDSTWTPGNQAPPAVDVARLGLQLGNFGLELFGTAGAVTDPDVPITVTVTNPRTFEAVSVEVAADGSFATAVSGEDGDVLELTAEDVGNPRLTSPPLALAPLVGDDGIAPRIDGNGMALDGDLLATCNDCVYFPGEFIGSFEVEIYDLTDPLRPILAASFAMAEGEGFPGEGDNACFDACDACTLECDNRGADLACYNACNVCSDTCFLFGGACEDACGACTDSCVLSGSNPDCLAACDACAGTCPGSTGGGTIDVMELPHSVDRMAIEDGVLAIAQGPYLRVVDARDPANPVLIDAQQTLQLAAGGTFVGLDVADGVVHLVGSGSPPVYYAVDVHDPRNPRQISEVNLAARSVGDIEVRDGLLHLLSSGTGSTGEYKIFAVGDPSAPLLRLSSDFGASARRGRKLAIVDDVAAYTLVSSDRLATVHRAQPPTEPANESVLPFQGEAVAEVGDKLMISATCCSDEIVIGALVSTPEIHSFSSETTVISPFSRPREIQVEDAVLWLNQRQGYQSRLLRPWLDADAVTIVAGAAGAEITGAAGAAVGAATVSAEAAGSSTTVAADGSFSLTVPAVEVGESVILQAVDASGGKGNKLRLRVPAGSVGGFFELADGVARLSADGGLAALVPARQEGATVTVPIVDTIPALVGSVEVAGPVSDVVLKNGVLYVAAATLEVFDLTDPASPVAAPSLDLYAGNPLLGLIEHGDALIALGAVGAGAELWTLDLVDPLAPVAVPAFAAATGAVTTPRLLVDGVDLWLIDDGQALRFALAAGLPPTLDATGSFAGSRLVDLAFAGPQIFAAVAGEGMREVESTGTVLTLGPPPPEAHAAFGVFQLAEPSGGVQTWWAEGLGGAKRLLREEPLSTGTLMVYGRIESRCAARDGEVIADDLYLLTDCGLLRIDRIP